MQPPDSLEGPAPQRPGPEEGELGEMPPVSTSVPALSQWEVQDFFLFFRSYCAPYTLLLFWLPLSLTAAVSLPVRVCTSCQTYMSKVLGLP